MDCSPGASFLPEGSDCSSDGALATAVPKPKLLSHKSTPSASSCSTCEGDVATWSEDESTSPLSQASGRALFKAGAFQDQSVVVHKTFVEREGGEEESALVQGCRPARRSASCPPCTWAAVEQRPASPLKRSAAVFDPALCDSEEWAAWEAAMSMEFSDTTWTDTTMADTMAWYISAEDPAAWDVATEGADYNWDQWAGAMADVPEGWAAPLERPRAPLSWMPPPPPPPPPPSHDAPMAAAPVEPRVKLNLSFAIEDQEEPEDENEENDEPSTEQANPDDPRLGTPELPTAGSAAHYHGTCKPCAFVNRNCARGTECSFCHLCGPDERKRRRKEKIAFLRQLRRTREETARPRWPLRRQGEE